MGGLAIGVTVVVAIALSARSSELTDRSVHVDDATAEQLREVFHDDEQLTAPPASAAWRER
jgi:predicted membrane-bound mannosyltransferase